MSCRTRGADEDDVSPALRKLAQLLVAAYEVEHPPGPAGEVEGPAHERGRLAGHADEPLTPTSVPVQRVGQPRPVVDSGEPCAGFASGFLQLPPIMGAQGLRCREHDLAHVFAFPSELGEAVTKVAADVPRGVATRRIGGSAPVPGLRRRRRRSAAGHAIPGRGGLTEHGC